MNDWKYSGEELEVFERAVKWKAYWVSMIIPYMGKRILEVGAGIGSTAATLKNLPCECWVSIEPDASLFKKISNKQKQGLLSTKVTIFNCTASELPRKDKFDTVIYIDVLEHIGNDAAELEFVSELLSEGGHIIIISPAHNFLFSPFDRKIGHYRRYNKKLLTGIVPAGMSILKMRYIDSIGFFASLANKTILKQCDPTSSQIAFWDKRLIPVSMIVDPLLLYSAGKSIFAVFKKEGV